MPLNSPRNFSAPPNMKHLPTDLCITKIYFHLIFLIECKCHIFHHLHETNLLVDFGCVPGWKSRRRRWSCSTSIAGCRGNSIGTSSTVVVALQSVTLKEKKRLSGNPLCNWNKTLNWTKPNGWWNCQNLLEQKTKFRTNTIRRFASTSNFRSKR